ncbi:MAG: hypothetical protein K6F04_04345 [bacterium]|nr:hypothetical protein [bacterium]
MKLKHLISTSAMIVAGFSSNQAGAVETSFLMCQSCPAGTYSTGGTSKSCTPCPAGQYQNLGGQTSCKACPAGQYSSTTGASSCSTCPAGTYSSAGSTSCTSCNLNKATATCDATTGKASSCNSGYYLKNGVCGCYMEDTAENFAKYGTNVGGSLLGQFIPYGDRTAKQRSVPGQAIACATWNNKKDFHFKCVLDITVLLYSEEHFVCE